MERVYDKNGVETYTRFWSEDQLEDLNADTTILKRILKIMKGCGLDSSGSGQGQVMDSPEHGNAPSGYTKCQILSYTGNCAIPKRQSYPCNELSWLEMGTLQNTRVKEFREVTSFPLKSKTPKQHMLARESPRTHG